MNSTGTGIITNVSSRTVKTQRGDAPIYDIETSIGKMSTFKRDVAESAHSLRGQPAEIEFQVTQNGSYTNYTLHGVLPSTNPAAQAQLAQAHGANGLLTQTVGVHQGPDAKDLSIWRQVAAKVSANLDPKTPADFWASCQALVVFFETGRIPQSSPTLNETFTDEFATVGAVAENFDSDIPFAPTI